MPVTTCSNFNPPSVINLFVEIRAPFLDFVFHLPTCSEMLLYLPVISSAGLAGGGGATFSRKLLQSVGLGPLWPPHAELQVCASQNMGLEDGAGGLALACSTLSSLGAESVGCHCEPGPLAEPDWGILRGPGTITSPRDAGLIKRAKVLSEGDEMSSPVSSKDKTE